MNTKPKINQARHNEINYVDQPPYQIVGEVKPFPQNMTVFSRVNWDPSCIGYGQKSRQADEIIKEGKSEYSRINFAIQSASWAVVSAMGNQAYSKDKNIIKRNNVKKYQPKNIARFTEQIRNSAMLYGASVIGITKIDRRWLYATSEGKLVDIADNIDTAIIMGVEMDGQFVSHSPSPLAAAATGNGYSRMVFTTACLSELLRNLGWQAIGCGNDTALSIPMAIDAGLGECGRNGMLITPEFGARLRLCKVLTDAPLLIDRSMEFGVMDFCGRCRECIEACPAEAIYAGEPTSEAVSPSNNTGVLKWPVNGEKCLHFWRTNGVCCSSCISFCPLSQ